MRLIDLDAIKLPKGFFEEVDTVPKFYEWLNTLPTVDPVKHGKWIKNEGRCGWHCSACATDDVYAFEWNSDKGENELQDHYCPNCGARMDMNEDV